MFEWEHIIVKAAPQVKRLEVPGGWIYYITPDFREPQAVFVPHGEK